MWWPGTELNRRHGDFQSPFCIPYVAMYQGVRGVCPLACAVYVHPTLKSGIVGRFDASSAKGF